jgi:hypothetical protein
MMKETPVSAYWDEKQVSVYLSIPLASLRDKRFRRVGIPYVKFGKSVRYSCVEVQRYAENARVQVAA